MGSTCRTRSIAAPVTDLRSISPTIRTATSGSRCRARASSPATPASTTTRSSGTCTRSTGPIACRCTGLAARRPITTVSVTAGARPTPARCATSPMPTNARCCSTRAGATTASRSGPRATPHVRSTPPPTGTRGCTGRPRPSSPHAARASRCSRCSTHPPRAPCRCIASGWRPAVASRTTCSRPARRDCGAIPSRGSSRCGDSTGPICSPIRCSWSRPSTPAARSRATSPPMRSRPPATRRLSSPSMTCAPPHRPARCS